MNTMLEIVLHAGRAPNTRPGRRRHSIALTMSSTTFFASPKTIMVLSM